MGLLGTQSLEPVVRNDVLSAEVLEFRTVSPRVLCKSHQVLGTVEITIMVSSDVRDEVSGLIGADQSVAYEEITHRVIVGG